MLKPLSQIANTIAVGLLAVACAPPGGGFSAPQTLGNQSTTGFANQEGRPYTVGGDSRLMSGGSRSQKASELPLRLGRGHSSTLRPTNLTIASKAEKASPSTDFERQAENAAPQVVRPNALATQILNAHIERLAQGSWGSAQPDRFGANQVRISIQLTNGTELLFAGNLGLSRLSSRIYLASLNSGKNYSAEVEFADHENGSGGVGRLTLKQLDSAGRVMDTAVLFSRSYQASITTELFLEQMINPQNREAYESLLKKSFGWVSNLVVQGGRAFYQVDVFADGDGKTGREQKLLSFAGESLRVSNFGSAQAKGLPGKLSLKNVELVGDAEDDDSRTFALTLKVNETSELKVTLLIERPEVANNNSAEPSHSLRGVSPNSLIPVRYGKNESPRINQMIDDFESNHSVPGVQRWITRYLSKDLSCLRCDLERAAITTQPFLDIIGRIFRYYDVAPQTALLFIVESRFFTSPDYPLQTARTSTAHGPFQLVQGTASGLGLKIFPNGIGLKPPAWDERNYFVPSACGAAKHLDNSLNGFAKRDAALAFLGYYMGDAGASKKIASALGEKGSSRETQNSLFRYSITFRQVAKQHMVGEQYIEYVYKALALYFLTGNPTAYGLSWQKQPDLKLPTGKVVPPNGAINDPSCQDAAQPLLKSGIIPL